MKEYFRLQFKMLNRQLIEWGIEPLIGYLVGIVVFVGISIKLFESTQYAEYLYVFFALSLVIRLSEVSRNEFLKLCYPKKEYEKLRVVENVVVATPFIVLLLFQGKIWSSVLLLLSTCLLTVFDFKSKFNFTLPTPFYKHPFEFTIGFRTNFFLFIIAYFLMVMALIVPNFNLGIFSLILVSLVCLNYYINSESEFYVWIFSMTPKEFISYKLKNIIQYSTLLYLPITIGLSVFFPEKIDVILGFQCLGYLFVFTAMLAKYSVFPEKLGLRLGIVLALTLWLPPLLLLIIPYLYIQSIKKLKEILQ
jgi:hypothetical protein